MFKAAGLTYDDFSKVEYLAFAESVDLDLVPGASAATIEIFACGSDGDD